ncbi:MAG: ABC transporter permease [Synergistaceae bacterium]|nr:ABC transporter permease [Synergistaceae bacterium]
MFSYIIKRLTQGLFLVFSVSVLVFAMLYMMPGDPIDQMMGWKVSQEKKDEMRHFYGFDLPMHEQYINWAAKIVKSGDFGLSIRTKLPVLDLMKARIPITLKFTGLTLLFDILIAVPLGLVCAYKKDSPFDRAVVGVSLFFTAIPQFWTAVLLILLFGVTWKILPLHGYETPLHLVLPVAAGVLGSFASTIRMTKSEVLDVIKEKYVLTAYAKGLGKTAVLIKHVLRNALILVTVLVSLSIPWLISGAVILEHIFGIPGMGGLIVNSIIMQDFAVVQACVLVISLLTVSFNLLCDFLIGILDPRISIALKGGER